MNYDVIVIGVGSMGSAACAFLAKQGLKVLGIEQFNIVHEKGSHAGQSRIIRKAYFEHPDYVPLLHKAYENWANLEQETNSKIYEQTGIAYFGKEFDPLITGVQQSAALYDLNLKRLNSKDGKEAFPAFNIPNDFIVLSEQEAGFITPERAILLYAEQAKKYGADILTNTTVLNWALSNNKVKVTTSKGEYTADKLVITAGAWTKKIVPLPDIEIQVTKQAVAWVKPKEWEKFKLGNFPCWLIQEPKKGPFYGFPILPAKDFGGTEGFKIAHHYPGEITDPDKYDSNISKGAIEDIRYVLDKYFDEGDAEILELKNCLYASTKDEDFIIDHLPDCDNRVVLTCGFSGHGFKFVSVVGEIIADLVIKENTDLPIEFLMLNRFN
jgi:sarcosine oxidase